MKKAHVNGRGTRLLAGAAAVIAALAVALIILNGGNPRPPSPTATRAMEKIDSMEPVVREIAYGLAGLRTQVDTLFERTDRLERKLDEHLVHGRR